MRPCSSVRRHLAHHAGREPRFYFEPWLIAELATVAAGRRKGHRIIVVVLGSSDRYADATALLNYAAASDR